MAAMTESMALKLMLAVMRNDKRIDIEAATKALNEYFSKPK